MNIIKLSRLTIQNFKGCARLSLDFAGRSASIYGENAAGKSTIYDAFTWLLFGRDSAGAAAFEVKPLGPDGQVRDHAAVTEVEAELGAAGGHINLRRTYFEKWSTRRGSAAASFDGNTSEYSVDGVPVKKYEYDRRVAELIGEDLFRTLTDVFWFCGKLDWRERRRALFEVCGIASDGDLLAGAPEFAPLAEAVGRLTLDDFKKKLQAERKGMSNTRNTIPARMDELQKTADELAGVDFAALRAERETTAGHLERLRSELLKLGHGALLDSKRNELDRARNALTACQNENAAHRASQIVPVEDRRPALRSAIERARRDRESCGAMVQQGAELSSAIEGRIEEYRARWNAENTRAFTATQCPTCGQQLPPAALEAARASFKADVEQRKREAVDGADREKQALQAAQERQKGYIRDMDAAGEELARLEAELAAYTPPSAPVVEDLPGYPQRVDELSAAVRELEAAVAELEGESATIRAEAEQKVNTLRGELDTLDRELGKESVLTYTRQRMEALRQEAREAGERLEALDKLLFLCDEFTRYKTRRVEESVNGRFTLVRWKLFEEQVNGGLSECCAATVDGVPYSDLNHGAKVNAGLDVIRTLSQHYGVAAPLFLDGAESVTFLLPVDGQVIRLVVSEKDKELRIDYGT